MELKKHGFKVYIRNPTSYTPLLEPQGKARSLTLSRSEENNKQQIAQFSQKDAEVCMGYVRPKPLYSVSQNRCGEDAQETTKRTVHAEVKVQVHPWFSDRL